MMIPHDSSFEKVGALMHNNASRLIGLYDELSAFLAQINLYHGRNISDSHELSLFLQPFNGHPWCRDTGTCMLDYNARCNDLLTKGKAQGQYIANPDPYCNCKKHAQ